MTAAVEKSTLIALSCTPAHLGFQLAGAVINPHAQTQITFGCIIVVYGDCAPRGEGSSADGRRNRERCANASAQERDGEVRHA